MVCQTPDCRLTSTSNDRLESDKHSHIAESPFLAHDVAAVTDTSESALRWASEPLVTRVMLKAITRVTGIVSHRKGLDWHSSHTVHSPVDQKENVFTLRCERYAYIKPQ